MEEKLDYSFEVRTDTGGIYKSKTLIVASGGKRKRLEVPEEIRLDGNGVAYCSTCDAPFYQDQDVAVVGGGNSALETVIDLIPYTPKIYLLIRQDQIKADPVLHEKTLVSARVQIIPHAKCKKFINATKSLFSFAQRIGYLQFNPAAATLAPKRKDTLGERILSEAEIIRMIALEPDNRNRAFLRVMYAAGGRVSEVCGLKWRDVQERDGGAGQITIFGKGGKTRVVLLSPETWAELTALQDQAGPDAPVFVSRKGGHLHPAQAWRIVRAAANRVGIAGQVSPHWLRHCHASHALDRGAPIHLVQATLGHASVATTGRYLHARPGDSSARYLGV